MAFAGSFQPAYHFRLLYLPGSFYPIMGALRYSAGQPWQVRPTKATARRFRVYASDAHAFSLKTQSGALVRVLTMHPG